MLCSTNVNVLFHAMLIVYFANNTVVEVIIFFLFPGSKKLCLKVTICVNIMFIYK